MRLIDGDAVKDKLLALVNVYPESYKAIRTAIEILDRSPIIEGAELEALADNIDYEWLLDQEY